MTDLGSSGLYGARLAVELRNKAGGIGGRQIALIEEDDQQEPEQAHKALLRLIEHGVVVVVGPMTSAVAVALAPVAEREQLLLLSPTASTTELSGLNDHFFRTTPSTREFAKTSADYYFQERGLRRMRPLFDLDNRAYTESWLNDFSRAFTAHGGTLLPAIGFNPEDDPDFRDLARQALADKPDGILLIANAVDGALLCQNLRHQNPSIAIGAAEWAASERFIELGEHWVDGVTLPRSFARDSTRRPYLAFRDAYRKRFSQEPAFTAIFAFDAANVIFDALEKRRGNQSLKQAILAQKTFVGAQRDIVFDASGDTSGTPFMNAVKDRDFVPIRAPR